MILASDLAEAREGATSVNKSPGSINSSLTVSAPCGAFWRLLGDLSVFIIISIRKNTLNTRINIHYQCIISV